MADDLFTTYEKIQTCRRTEVTLENIHLLAQHFGGTVTYGPDPYLTTPQGSTVAIGAWVDEKGSRWNAPGPLGQGWHKAGSFEWVEV